MSRLKSTAFPVRGWWWLVPLLLLIAALGARSINADAIWFDEYWSLYQSGAAHYGPLSPLDIWQRVADTSVWPPAYHLTLAAWEAVAGSMPFAGRWLALLFGLLTVAVTYRLGRDLFRSTWVGGDVAALGAAVAMGGSAYFVNYLHELRGYTLYTLVVAFGVWAYWRAVTIERPTWRTYAALLIGLTGLLYIHFFAALVFIALGLYHLLFVAKTRRWWLITFMAVMAGVLFLPWVRQALRDLDYAQTGDAFRLRALSAGEVLTGLVAAFGNGSVALLAFVMAFALGAKGRSVRLLWLWLIVVLVGGLLVNEALRILTEVRYLLALWPALALLFGVGIQQLAVVGALREAPLRRINIAALILVLWLAAGVWNSLDPAFGDNTRKGAFTDLPLRELRATLAERAQADDAIVLERPDHVWALQPVFDYYTHGLPGRYAIMETLLGRQQDDEFYWQVKAFLVNAPRVWIAVDKTLPPNFRLA
ncbi:MAG: glycosyltransferase family 39 protein, partial [Burkholderiales bacterium]|nr:glycosyltransferase family 39 protein [Anaerolineae bacterium]